MVANFITKMLTLTIAVLTLGCSNEDETHLNANSDTNEPTDTNTSIRILALGDSYTIGQGVAESGRWPNQLSTKLKEKGISIKEPTIIARTGWTTRDLLNAIEDTDLSTTNKNTIVSLLIGVNNQYQNKDFNIFQTEFDQLLQKAIQISGSTQNIFTISIPDYGVTPFGNANKIQIAKELDAYNNYIETKSKDLGIAFINITEISRSLENDKNALATDQLHPSATQYGKWVEKMVPIVAQIASNPQ